MSLLRSREVILEIERTCDVNALRYKGLRIWPLIRANIRTILERPEYKPAQERPKGDLRCASFAADQEQLTQLREYEGADFMFVSRPEEHCLRISGRYYDTWLDPYIEMIQGRYSHVKTELATSRAEATCPRSFETVFLKATEGCFHIPDPEGAIPGFEEIRERVAAICAVDLDICKIALTANAIEQYRLYYLDILSAIQPRAVVFVCYYGEPAMGLVWACRDLNITSVDMQHAYLAGHLYYEDWSSLPPDGYELVPDMFHVWSDSTRNDIETSQTSDCCRHKAIVGHNGWMYKATHGELPVEEIEQVDRDFLLDLEQRDRVILVTLPPTPDPLPEHLLDAIERLEDTWLWLMRCHPKCRHRQHDIVDMLEARGIGNYEMENSARCPLFLLLERSTHHLTALSAVCLEALLYGVPTTFYFQEAYERYHKHIDAGFFNCVPSSADDLVTVLSLDYDRAKIVKLSEYFFDMDEQTGPRAFDEILAYSADREFRPLHDSLRATNSNQAGLEFVEQGDWDRAMHSFWSAVSAEPSSTDYLNNLAAACWSLDRSQEAAKCVEAALRINPEDARSVNNYRELVKAGIHVKTPACLVE